MTFAMSGAILKFSYINFKSKHKFMINLKDFMPIKNASQDFLVHGPIKMPNSRKILSSETTCKF